MSILVDFSVAICTNSFTLRRIFHAGTTSSNFSVRLIAAKFLLCVLIFDAYPFECADAFRSHQIETLTAEVFVQQNNGRKHAIRGVHDLLISLRDQQLSFRCPKALEHYYLQLKDNFLDQWASRHSVSEERCWEMAALALKVDKGDNPGGYVRRKSKNFLVFLDILDQRSSGISALSNIFPSG